MAYHAVITGDIIGSRLLSPVQKKQTMEVLKACFLMLQKRKDISFEKGFEIFRGDSFQGVLRNPALALRVALIIRTCLMKQKITAHTKIKSNLKKPHQLTDTRIGIGIGNINYKANKVIESDGEAFQLSGMLVDTMKSSGKRIMVGVPDKALSEVFQLQFTLLDFIVNKWTEQQCEAIFEILIHNYNQQQLSQKLKISQPSIHQRLKISGWYAVAPFIEYYETLKFSAA